MELTPVELALPTPRWASLLVPAAEVNPPGPGHSVLSPAQTRTRERLYRLAEAADQRDARATDRLLRDLLDSDPWLGRRIIAAAVAAVASQYADGP